ncbi:hypothetical protein [Rudaeicoccus suwonensis]|uniref:hypothetical protein n=1 Tax=Rudaeicoccus suwonensis TaxID=657409 RepID=UPI0011A6DF2C|nr:hypothetical protein [Rudaeicoccus suwonensis]
MTDSQRVDLRALLGLCDDTDPGETADVTRAGARDSSWHDHDVAIAATAWLAAPRNSDAYRRLVEAVDRRNQWLQPVLTESSEQPEILDEVGADRPPASVGDVFGGLDARAALERLRRGIDG